MCGIIAIFGADNAVYEIKTGLDEIQHRGQNGAGIYTYGERSNHIYGKKGSGLIRDVFGSRNDLDGLEGYFGIGHVRYPTIGGSKSHEEEGKYAQPFESRIRPRLILAHNGNIINATELGKRLNEVWDDPIVKNEGDAEVIANVLADSLSSFSHDAQYQYVFKAVGKTVEQLNGSYAVISIIEDVGMLAFRDPHKIRPLVMGYREKDDCYAFASEVVALNRLGYNLLSRTVKGGEAVLIPFETRDPIFKQVKKEMPAPCFFEAVYFSDVTSTCDGTPVYDIREKHGQLLAKSIIQCRKIKLEELDFVAPIPDGGNALSSGLAETLDIPRKDALRKSKYVGRSFIANTTNMRRKIIRSKFSVIDSVVSGKKFVLTDDSIVRGNTTKEIIRMLYNAGAEEIHLAIGNAPTINVCQLGIDMPEPNELLAYCNLSETHTDLIERVRKTVGATTLVYLTLDQVAQGFGKSSNEMCMGCIGGHYPIEPRESFTKQRTNERKYTYES